MLYENGDVGRCFAVRGLVGLVGRDFPFSNFQYRAKHVNTLSWSSSLLAITLPVLSKPAPEQDWHIPSWVLLNHANQ